MTLFKKGISLEQFIADAIFNSVNFYNSNSGKLILMADEFKVLNKDDAEELRELGYALIITDITMSCLVNFSEKVSSKEISEMIGFLYVRFLGEVEHLAKDDIKRRTDVFEKLLGAVETNEKKENTEEDLKLLLCSTFAELYSGSNLKDKKVEGKRFAAFKIAKAIVKANIIRTMLKEFKIN